MTQSESPAPGLRSTIVLLLPLGLWGMLWLSLSAGDPRQIFAPDSAVDFFHGVRAIFPFLAGYLALTVISLNLFRHRPRGFRFVGPLALTVVYGLVGVAASVLSPSTSVALRWAGAYLAVPIVLWAIVWGTDTLERVSRLINITWLVIILGVAALFAVALMELGLGDVISHPETLLECKSGGWHDLTSGRLRDTGVGRYAAIAAIIALSGLFIRSWRPVSILVLLAAVVLLLFTGARGAFMGFAAGAALVVLFNSGKRTLLAGTVAIILLLPLVWSTGIHQTFLSNCIFRVPVASPTPDEPVELAQVQIQSGVWELKQVPPQEQETPQPQAASELPVRLSIGSGVWKLKQAQPRDQDLLDGPALLQVPPGEWVLELRLKQQASGQGQDGLPLPIHLQVPQGNWTLELAPPQNPATTDASPPVKVGFIGSLLGRIPDDFYRFTGRSPVWAEGWKLFKQSPLVGYGFHADRLLLGTHMHNAVMHSLIQTGLLGTIPFLAAIVYGWVLLVKRLRCLSLLPVPHKHLVIQTGGMLAFFSLRAFPESTGAFFGVDWLILAPILLYLQVVNETRFGQERGV